MTMNNWRMRPRTNEGIQFWQKVSATGNVCECWDWTGCRNGDGYGRLNRDGRTWLAHRFSWLRIFVHNIPDGFHLDHLCRNPSCVNPWHLEPVTSRENTLRGGGPSAIHAAKTHCPAGHPYSAGNTAVRGGKRFCRECARIRKRKPFAIPNSRKTHCPSGHEYTPENTRIARDGGRRCHECQRLSNSRRSCVGHG